MPSNSRNVGLSALLLVAAALLAASLRAAQLPTAHPASGLLTIVIGNVRNARGLIHVDLCPEARFTKEDCPYSADVPAIEGTTVVTLHDVAAGKYAVQATHDENANHKVDRALFGIPKEGVGFSRDAPIRFGPPKWQDAMFAFDGRAGRVAFRMRYFLGPSGPAKRG